MTTGTTTPTYAPPPPAGITPSAGLTITPNGMAPVTPLQTVPPPVDTTNHTGITTGVTQGIIDEYAALNQAKTASEASQGGTRQSILDSMGALMGKTRDTQAANTAAGVDTETANVNNYTAQLADLNSQAKSLNREALAIPIQTQERNSNTGATDDGVAPQNAAALRQNALKALSLGQQADIASAALTGSSIRLQAAKDKAQQMIDLKYNPLEQELAIKQKQYDLNKDALSAIDAKRTEALGVALKKEAQDLADQKDLEKNLSTLKIEIAKNGGDPSIVDGAKNFSEAINKAGSALVTPNTEILKLGDNQAYLIDKNTGKIIRSFGAGPTGGSGGVSVAGKNGPQYNGVVDTILASGKFTKDQASAVRNAINNGEDPFTVVKNNAKNIMGQTEATTVTKYETAESAMKDLQTSLADFYKNGGKTNIFTGNYENVINKLGEVNDPKLVDLAVQIQANLQVYRNAVSGTAYSEKEGQDIASIFPGINKTQGLNEAIINGRVKAFNSTIDGTYRSTLGSAYDKLKSLENSTSISKGSLSDKDFVAKAFENEGSQYQDVVNATPANSIPVVDNETGVIGYIPVGEFNASKYTKI